MKPTETATLPLTQIRTDGDTQPRAAIDQAVVEEYSVAIHAGAKFPPVDVFFDGKDHWLADGFHRLAAHEKAGLTTIAATVHDGTQADAQAFAAGANQTHGLHRTNADKARAVLLALKVMADKSDYEIAKHVGVGHSMVGDARSRIYPKSIDAPAQPSLPVEQPARTVQRKGKTYTMDTKNIGKKKRRSSVDPDAGQPAKAQKPVKFNPPSPFSAPVQLLLPMDPARAVATFVSGMGLAFSKAFSILLQQTLEGK